MLFQKARPVLDLARSAPGEGREGGEGGEGEGGGGQVVPLQVRFRVAPYGWSEWSAEWRI